MNTITGYGLLLCLLFCGLQTGFANTIDSLYTKEQVWKYLEDSLGQKGVIFPVYCTDISQAEKIKMYLSEYISVEDPITGEVVLRTTVSREFDSTDNCCKDYPFVNESLEQVLSKKDLDRCIFYKADLDHNGYTDLVVYSGNVVVVMDKGNGVDGYTFSEVPDAIKLEGIVPLADKTNGILLKYMHCGADTAAIDTIVYKFNAFVKYNAGYQSLHISKINYYYSNSSARYCFERQSCMEINKDGRCFLKYAATAFEPGRYDTTFSAMLDRRQVDELLNLVAYIDVKSKKDVYSSWINHGEGGRFSFHFEDGTTKKIEVWSCPAPISLGYLSKNIAAISRELEWLPAENREDFECPCEYTGFDSKSDCGAEW
ncbi:MAG: hypothetical protein KDC07_00985 [Chitinophagaceae bacterium]|nr:hypothetical protein [Chitinophagaceae bacterium]MCB9045816.1 hypothetical protein [Chitinophagales bacterium]